MPIDTNCEKRTVNVALLTVSDTRNIKTDTSGALLKSLVEADGHRIIEQKILVDEVEGLAEQLLLWIEDPKIDVVISSGGTGVTGRDVTPEAFYRVYDKEIPGFGELFRMLSYPSIGTSTMQSRCTGGVARGTYLFALPGSSGAVRDGWEKILTFQLDSRHRPCNLVELMPRLKEQ